MILAYSIVWNNEKKQNSYQQKVLSLPIVCKNYMFYTIRKWDWIWHSSFTFYFLGDLWGPLILCIILASLLQSSRGNDGAPEFAQVFAIVWLGASVVTFNSKLLGGNMYVLDILNFLILAVWQIMYLPNSVSTSHDGKCVFTQF